MRKLLLIAGFLAGIVIIGLYVWYQRDTGEGLSRSDRAAIASFREKYQRFPGPSDVEVEKVARILTGSELTSERIEALLGKPSDIANVPEQVQEDGSRLIWAYDIGDSRRISIYFSATGRVTSIEGSGVGFDMVASPRN